MNRRRFLQGCAASIASVAIGLRLAHGAPQLEAERYTFGWSGPRVRWVTPGEFERGHWGDARVVHYHAAEDMFLIEYDPELPKGWSSERIDDGVYRIYHHLG